MLQGKKQPRFHRLDFLAPAGRRRPPARVRPQAGAGRENLRFAHLYIVLKKNQYYYRKMPKGQKKVIWMWCEAIDQKVPELSNTTVE